MQYCAHTMVAGVRVEDVRVGRVWKNENRSRR